MHKSLHTYSPQKKDIHTCDCAHIYDTTYYISRTKYCVYVCTSQKFKFEASKQIGYEIG